MADESQSSPESNVTGWRLLGTRDFGCLWAGQVISQIGDGLNKVALLWFVYEMTGSALKMTAIGLLQTIPPLVFGPLIGVYLDHLPKKTVMIVVDLLRTLMVLLIPLAQVSTSIGVSDADAEGRPTARYGPTGVLLVATPRVE